MTRYIMAATPEAAEKAMKLVGEKGSFATLAEAEAWWESHPKPCKYTVWPLRRRQGGVWRAIV